MNCKPNDLAVCVSSPAYPELVGRIFRVTEVDAVLPMCWHTDPKQHAANGDWVIFADDTLRPLRDSDGQDEALTWQPVGETA